ncbi:MAG: hypothetical protein HBSAPP03_26910 [Phycisphaerae bacterium]|nr:MAG: hypothetical protein HBSAPP03_26910 [Phycisphaerae bacterium]
MTRTADNTGSAWYHDEGSILGLARRVHAGIVVPTIPGYEDLTEIKRGGQGVVFSGVQRSTRQRVAIKVLLGGALASPTARARFEREAELAASLRHPAIVRVYDRGGTTDGLAYLVMEFVDGQPLDEVLRATPAPRGTSAADEVERCRRVEMYAGIVDAVAHAHQRGVIHRDLKPSNVRIDLAGKPRVLDFGLAKAHGQDVPDVSVAGQIFGSLPWASPEQTMGDPAAVDVRSDVYALGVMLYQMLTGRFPYPVEGDVVSTIRHIREHDPVPPRSIAPGLDEDLATMVLTCLAKEPDRRYQSAMDLAHDVRAWLRDEPIRARQDHTWYTLRKLLKRHRREAAAMVVVLAVLIGGAIWLSVLYARATESEQQARQSLGDARRELDEKSAAVGFLRDMLASPNPGVDGRNVRVVDLLRSARLRLDDTSLSPASRAILAAAMGDTYIALGQFDQAEPLMALARDLRREIHGPAHPEALRALARFGYLRCRQGKLDEGEAIAREASEAIANFPLADRVRVRANDILGLALHYRGKNAEAEVVFRASMQDQLDAQAADGPEYEDTVGNLAVCLRQMERVPEALSLYEQEIARIDARGRALTPGQFTMIGNYASALHSTGAYDTAERMYRRAIDGLSTLLGDEHDDTLSAISNLGTLLIQRGRFDEAETILRRGEEAARRTLGEENPTSLTFAHNLSKAMHEVGKFDEAERLMRRTLDLRIKVLTEEHPHTLVTMSNLAALCRDLGRADEAFDLDRRALATRRRVLGERNTGTLISYSAVGLRLVQTGDATTGEAHLHKAVETAVETLGPDAYFTGVFRGNLGKGLDLLGRPDDAERELLECYRVLAKTVGETDKRTRAAARTLETHYAAAGQRDQAEAWAARAK